MSHKDLHRSLDPEPALREWAQVVEQAGQSFEATFARTGVDLEEAALGSTSWSAFSERADIARAELLGPATALRLRWRDLEPALERAIVQSSANSARHLRWRIAEARRSGETAARKMELRTHEAVVRRAAQAARLAYRRAASEWTRPRTCPSCKGPILVGGLYRSMRFTCPNCRAVHPQDPGAATRAWLETGGPIDTLADEASLASHEAMVQATHTFQSLFEPTIEDHEVFSQSVRAHWESWVKVRAQLDPSLDANARTALVDQRVTESLGETTHSLALKARKRRSEGVALAKAAHLQSILDWIHLQEQPAPHVAHLLAACLHEHGLRAEAWQILALEHHLGQLSEDRDAWMRRQLAELDQALTSR
jgi:hypothetical protein